MRLTQLVRTALLDICTLDLRSLSLFRIFLGIFLCVDLGIRFSDVEMFYSDLGVLSSSYISRINWSIHAWYGSVEWQYFLFGLSAVSALLLLLGFYTRVATVVAYVLTASVQLRNPAVNNAGDLLLACVLFISIFLPLSSYFSLDSRKVQSEGQKFSSYSSPWVAVYLLQLILLYSISGFSKNNGTWNFDGLGIYYALNLHTYAKSSAIYLLYYPWILWLLNYLTLFLERVLWLGLLIPRKNGWIRSVLVLSFMSFHLGLFCFMELGTFPFLGMIIWIPLIPAIFWRWISYVVSKSIVLDKYKNEIYNQWNNRGLWLSAFLFVFLMIYSATGFKPWFGHPRYLDSVIKNSRLKQEWSLFSGPKKYDGWLVVEGKLQDGQVVDLLRNGAEINWEKPALFSAQFPNHRQRKYFKSLRTGFISYRSKYLDWVMSKWNQEHPENQVESATFYFLEEAILPNGQFGSVKKKSLSTRTVQRDI
ncbi:HTTM domain-containing protein [Reichenbachiella agarivorans]|uniref:HTTM domain-containing protein n=1 Tax=Reichenbachiella agarivorans TaxID=2979464 RepID=A0ABY6CMV7_9BACT|nr:HTTM domain-containing protein [Reichenbachiella agarivorans]UXP31848.1 HTTM domain-containing protein [Reichenbachiella agarivorans]